MSLDKIGGRARAEEVAGEAFAFLAEDEDRLYRFLDMTGLRPDSIREAAAQPGFLVAVLDHVLSDDELVLAVAGRLGIRPERVQEARWKLQPPDGFE